MNRLSCDGANNAAIALMIGACVGILFRLITTSNTYEEEDPYLEAVKSHAKKALYPDATATKAIKALGAWLDKQIQK